MSLCVSKHGTHLVLSKTLYNYTHRNSIDTEGMFQHLSFDTLFTMQCLPEKL